PHRLLEPELERRLEVADLPPGLPQLVLDHLADARALLHQDQRPLGKAIQAHGLARKRMPRRADQDHLVAKERLERDRAVAARGADDPELEATIGDELDDRLRVRYGEGNVERGVRALKLAQEERQHDRRGTGRGADLERPLQRTLGPAQLLEQLLLEREQALRAPVEAQSGLGRLDPAARAVEQLRAEPLLER